MDTIAATAFGIKIESLKDENNPFILHVKTSSGENSLKNPMSMLRCKSLQVPIILGILPYF